MEKGSVDGFDILTLSNEEGTVSIDSTAVHVMHQQHGNDEVARRS